ncbi:VOC family protein [Nocardia huaxiensis]|uniref:VOC family protein n=1 Tax=Nocardia huaxiensis TaxID=2755382 RepID=UPI001E2B795E|nr:VOC family protein [Nocardia huaxiensis]UFS97181.1 VOC family protein [Nocardia huaxiensis]
MERVTGIGGFFCTAKDPNALNAWYAEHLGVVPPPETYDVSPWWQDAGPTVFAAFPPDSADWGDWGPPDRPWRLNFRVRDLDAMVAQLRSAGIGVTVLDEVYPNGRFARLADPEGNPLELWEPTPADLEPPTA